MTDGEAVAVARRIDKLHMEIGHLIDCLRVEHANGEEIEIALEDNDLRGLAWATHVIHSRLEHPERWETGSWGIRRKRGRS